MSMQTRRFFRNSARIIWNSMKAMASVLSECFSVFMLGRCEDRKTLDFDLDATEMPQELLDHVSRFDFQTCGCRKCVAFLLIRNRQLARQNRELLFRWHQVFGIYGEPMPKAPIRCFDKDGREVRG